MNLLAVERIKLFSTRLPWWCIGIATVLAVGVAGLVATASGEQEIQVADTELGAVFGSVVVMVMAAVAVTGEYRYGTIRPTLLVTPNRARVVLGKAAFLAGLAAAVGLLHGFGAYLVARALATAPVETLSSAGRWREVAGFALHYALAAVIAVAVAFCVRSAAAAVTGLLLWIFLVERLVVLAGDVGARVQDWMPFVALGHAVGQSGGELPYGPWFAFGYAALLAGLLLLAAVVVVGRRDA